MNTLPLQLNHVSKFYDAFCAVNEVSFEVKEGEIFGLLGPNGAGKSSLISMITSLSSISEGSISVFGYDVEHESLYTRRCLGIVPQEIVTHGYFSLREILLYHAGFYGYLQHHKRVDYLLEKLQLTPHRNKSVRELSGGMKRRMLIAKALVHSPKLLLLDEPTAGVDVELRRNLWDFVRELNKEGVTVLLTTHYLEEAEALCDRIAIIHKGTLQKLGNTKQMVKELTQRELCLRLSIDWKSHSDYLVSREGKIWKFKIPSHMGVGEFLKTQKIPLEAVQDLHLKEGNLEEAFEKVIGGSYA